MMKKNRYIILAIGLTIITIIFYCIIKNDKREAALKDYSVVNAKINRIEITRGSANIYVQYEYNGKNIGTVFYTYHADKLKEKDSIKLKVSKQYPDQYVEPVEKLD